MPSSRRKTGDSGRSPSGRRRAGRLGRDFYRRDAVTVARELLGQRLVHVVDGVRLAGLIVETEAYLGIADRAAHSFGGRRTRRTETMYADGGTAYVFLNYGIHHLLNVVVGGVDDPAAVLIRALQPVEGLDLMFSLRPAARHVTQLCSGPGRVGAALAVELSHDGTDLVTCPTLFIERAGDPATRQHSIVSAARIGVEYAGEWAVRPLRFYLDGNPHVSVCRKPAVTRGNARRAGR